jgi:hypothetical protein
MHPRDGTLERGLATTYGSKTFTPAGAATIKSKVNLTRERSLLNERSVVVLLGRVAAAMSGFGLIFRFHQPNVVIVGMRGQTISGMRRYNVSFFNRTRIIQLRTVLRSETVVVMIWPWYRLELVLIVSLFDARSGAKSRSDFAGQARRQNLGRNAERWAQSPGKAKP